MKTTVITSTVGEWDSAEITIDAVLDVPDRFNFEESRVKFLKEVGEKEGVRRKKNGSIYSKDWRKADILHLKSIEDQWGRIKHEIHEI